MTLKPFDGFEKVFKEGSDRLTIGFCDPSSNPGWPLRNFLYFVSHTWGNVLKEVDVLCYRDNMRDGKHLIGHPSPSLSLSVSLLKTYIVGFTNDGLSCR